jgi:hypothetical protein
MVAEPAAASRSATNLQETTMTRNFLLIGGAVAWSVAAVDLVIHLMAGDFLVPGAMTAIFVFWMGLRAAQPRRAVRRRVAVTA